MSWPEYGCERWALELEAERRHAAEAALNECQQAGVSENSLKTLAFECGIKLEKQNAVNR